VRGGTYPRGCQEKPCIDEMEKPIHNVTLNDFYIGQTEVTQAQWRKIMGTSPSYYSGCDQCPVESISWFDIQEFLRRSNNRTSGGQFRLPTEAEWEYAARGGHMRHKDRQPDVVQISEIGWHLENSGGKTHPVKGKIPNQLGLYDMIGNVWEWCSDWYDTYKSKSLTNPTGPVSGALRVTRGCSYMDQSHFCRPVMRWHEHPESKMASIGFRIVFQTD
jgi:sulfatase modifying factor 1